MRAQALSGSCGLWLVVVIVAWLCVPAEQLGAEGAPRIVRLTASAEQVGRYQRLDFDIDPGAVQGNPFDPDQIDVHLELTGPDGRTLVLPAFYDQPHERRPVENPQAMRNWLYPVGPARWGARFAPMEVGAWTAMAVVRDRAGEDRSEPVRFTCEASTSRGFVRVSQRDRRFLEFSNGQPYFAIGQNIAFVKSLERHEQMCARLAENGGNYVRVWADCRDWGIGLEGRKSAFGRAGNWEALSIAPMPGLEGFHLDRLCIRLPCQDGATVRVAPSHALALRADTRYVLRGQVRTQGQARLRVDVHGTRSPEPLGGSPQWTAFRQEFATDADQWWLDGLALRREGQGTVWVRDLSLREADAGPELLWEADVNRPVVGVYNLPDCAMLDAVVEMAQRYGLYIQLVVLPRDLYRYQYPGFSRDPQSLDYDQAIRRACNLMRYAIARWGYSTNIAIWEHFNEMDASAPTDRFYDEVGRYIERTDPYGHLRATSNWHSNTRDWPHPRLDLADIHSYIRPDRGHQWKDEVAFLLERVGPGVAANLGKPLLLSEFGLANERFGFSDQTRRDQELVHVHNSLWASSLSGLAGTAMFWWWNEMDRMDIYRHYQPLSRFLADVPFTTGNLRPLTDLSAERSWRVVGLAGADRAYLWLSDPRATWWSAAVEKTPLEPVRGATVELPDLAAGEYQVQWWDTWTGQILRRDHYSLQPGRSGRLSAPDFTRDIACKLIPAVAGQPLRGRTEKQ